MARVEPLAGVSVKICSKSSGAAFGHRSHRRGRNGRRMPWGGLASAAAKLSSNVLRSICCSALWLAMREDGGDLTPAELAPEVRSVVMRSKGDTSEDGGLVFLRPFDVSIQRCASSFMSGSSRVAPSRTFMTARQTGEVYVC